MDRELPGVIIASLTTLSLGVVLGPEAPLIAIGGGLAVLTVHLVKKDTPPMALTVIASAGSFAAISSLLGSPLLGAFLIMEVAGIGGATLSLVMLPGLLASGIGALVFVGLDNWTGLGEFSLVLPRCRRRWARQLPPWPGRCHRRGRRAAGMGDSVDRSVAPPARHLSRILVTPALGVLIGLTAMIYQLVSDNSFTDVLYSGSPPCPGSSSTPPTTRWAS